MQSTTIERKGNSTMQKNIQVANKLIAQVKELIFFTCGNKINTMQENIERKENSTLQKTKEDAQKANERANKLIAQAKEQMRSTK